MDEDGLYQRLGEEDGIRAVVDTFYDRVVEDDLLGPLFADADLVYLRQTLTHFLCDAAGGPQTYEGPPIREAHINVGLEPKHVWRAVSILAESLDEHGVPEADADTVVDAVASYEKDLLDRPDDLNI